ncbi:MAG: sigma-70 family RNA polymerase sigma factor [bacterium]|nr:sigma-70 family RNA polymerase sigma factor [bacterium]
MDDRTRETDETPHRDAELLRASQAGDEAALDELVTRNYGMLRAFIRMRLDPATRARESASDLAQSVCREVLKRADQYEYRGDAAFRSWLCEAALRKLRDRYAYHRGAKRDPRREQAPAASNDGWRDLAQAYRTSIDPVGRALRKEELEQLERAFDALDDTMREALSLRQICEMPYGEIATRLDRSEDAVRKIVSRARARIAVTLGQTDTSD